MFNFLRSDKPQSAMRVNFTLIAVGVFIVLISLAYYIVKKASSPTELTQWLAMGGFAVGLASVVTGMAWQKTEQKKVEALSAVNAGDPPDPPGPGDGTGKP